MSGNGVLPGDIVLKYFELGPQGGRGGVVRNMLFVHDVEFEESKLAPDETWLVEKERLISTGECPIGAVPVLYIGDKPYFGHIPIARYLASKVSQAPPPRYDTQCCAVRCSSFGSRSSLFERHYDRRVHQLAKHLGRCGF